MKMHPIFHVSILEKCIQPPPLIKMGSKEEFEFEEILDLQVFHESLEF
jgi:hypothetical protein